MFEGSGGVLRVTITMIPPGSGPSGPTGPPPLSGPAELLVEAVRLLAAQDATSLPGVQALHETAVLLTQHEALQAVLLTRIADANRRQLHQLDDAPSMSSWIERQDTGIDRRAVTLARRLSDFPALSTAITVGQIPVVTAQHLATALAKVRHHLDRPDGLIDGQDAEAVITNVITAGVRLQVCEAVGSLPDGHSRLVALMAELTEIAGRSTTQVIRLEAALLVLARHLEARMLPQALERLVDAILPLKLEDRAEQAHRRRGLTITRNADGSGFHLSQGELDLECGELLHAALRAAMNNDSENPDDTDRYARLRENGWQDGDPLPNCSSAPRTGAQRRHDALAGVLRGYLDAGAAGLVGKHHPHLDVVVGLDTLAGEPGALPATGASGTALPISLVRRLSCDASVTRYILSLGRRVLEVSHSERTLKAPERRALLLQAAYHCQVSGCHHDHTSSRLVPHHGTPWSVCHTTSLGDTALVCEGSHHDLHTGNKILRLRDGRRLGPRGWEPD